MPLPCVVFMIFCGAEMRLRVKEHVVKKNDNSELPKNIRQVGNLDLDKRVYIEDYAFSFVKEISLDIDEEGKVGVLLGEEKNIDGEEYTFVYAAIEVANASVFEGKVGFTQETWPFVDATCSTYFPDMSVVGWYLVSSSIRPESNAALERVHIDSIGRYKVLLYVNPSEKTEDVYSCFDGGLECLDGYVIYFDRNEQMQRYMADVSSQRKRTAADETAMKRYRQIMKESKSEPKAKQQLSIMYALSAILVIFVLVAGATRLQAEKSAANGDNIVESGGDYVDSSTAVNATPSAVPDETLDVNYANGNVDTTASEENNTSEEVTQISETTTPQESTDETEETTTEEETTEETTTEEETTEEETTQEHRTYVVQDGDTLYGIIKREYGSDDPEILRALFELNDITDGGDSIAPGDELLLP